MMSARNASTCIRRRQRCHYLDGTLMALRNIIRCQQHCTNDSFYIYIFVCETRVKIKWRTDDQECWIIFCLADALIWYLYRIFIQSMITLHSPLALRKKIAESWLTQIVVTFLVFISLFYEVSKFCFPNMFMMLCVGKIPLKKILREIIRSL